MEFQFETLYDHVGLTAMAKALRKIYRRKKSLITKIIGIVLFLVGLYFSTPLGGRELKITPNSLITYISLAMLLIVILFEDAINGFGAMKRLVDGREEAISTFEEDFYTVKTDLETTNWEYTAINHLAETKHYYVFIFTEHHAQIFDKDNLSGGTEEEFVSYIEGKTGLKFKKV